MTDFDRYQTRPVTITNERWDPLTGLGSSGFSTIKGMVTSAGDMVVSPYSAVQKAAPEDSAAKTTGKAIANFGKSFGKFNGRLFHGAIIDLPLAAAEGLRAVPKLYGEEVQSHREIKDAASGFSVGGKNFVQGMSDGISGLFMKPMQGMKEEGALGFAKGTGKGVLGLATKTTSAAIGIVAYPGQGISKSVTAPFKSTTRKTIMSQRLAEGEHTSSSEASKIADVLRSFEELVVHSTKGKAAIEVSGYFV
ncbi:hypothetical protein SLS60_005337 [Paraconiothyrium brasiliense]|uniref:Uncharacterized protein n=1 Tax=Paraconiothyrium brasiliense TaxID=300254 RepID=A0ABR3RIM0_9PLEO